ncbi:hypothetical protein R3W88_008972 [Solanum pinnatisectum]|uniref:Cyclin C-terminal domain-containing protein n=1 Tax=Solanum pinnatisectum TaxID=50273 RepID=A0AAV9M9K4_9SOLN|nr:hypothetical protein R3W88_008972 [Solanum pinnatisectum]
MLETSLFWNIFCEETQGSILYKSTPVAVQVNECSRCIFIQSYLVVFCEVIGIIYLSLFVKELEVTQQHLVPFQICLYVTVGTTTHYPSVIAAAIAISFAVKTETVDSEKAVFALVQHVQKDKVMKCIELIQELCLASDFVKVPIASSIPSVPQSPIGRTDGSGVESRSNSLHSSPVKRRKLNT